jgi:hypothetical protein
MTMAVKPGRRSKSLAHKVLRTDQQGNGVPLRPQKGAVSFEISPSPVFIENVAECRQVTLGPPSYGNPAPAQNAAISALSSLHGWRPVPEPNPDLDNGNFDMPRQKGEFEVTAEQDAEKGQCVQFRLKNPGARPPWIPAYQALACEQPIPVSGKPTAIGLNVRGNSGWGRIDLELRDSKGERWLSVGMPGAWNANDEQSVSYVNFDGWRWMEIPLPGHYPGGFHWPRYANWRHDAGDGIVDYPLSLAAVIVEERRKVVYVNEMVDASPAPVRLSGLMALYGDPEQVGDWEERLLP